MGIRTISIPLITEPWERDLLYRRMELCRSIYNAELSEVERRFNAIQNDADYQSCREIIDEAYSEASSKDRSKAKNTEAYRNAVKEQTRLLQAYNLTSYSVNNRAIELAKPYSTVLPSRVAHFTVGSSLWQALHNILIGKQTGFCYKRAGDVHNLSSDGRSGIRLLGSDGKSSRDGIDLRARVYGDNLDGNTVKPAAPSVVFGKGKGRRAIRLPLAISLKDAYTVEALSYPYHVIRITRKEHKGQDRYYLQLVSESKGP